MDNSHARILMLTASMLVLGYTAPAIARDAPKPSDTGAAATPASDTPSDKGSLGDIIVTAERRSQNLLTVPMSISALTGLQLQDQGIKEITSLQFTTPGFLPENGVGYVQIFMRGIGNNLYVGTGPSVTTYIDDVPRIFASQVNSFADVERVEVLKGAQGGLYGNNSTGGVINIITRQPGDKLAADATVSYGQRRTLDAKAYFNVPLSDNIAWNFAVTRESHDPYIKNVTQNPAPYTAAMFPVDGSSNSDGTVNHNPYGTPAQTAAFFNSGVNPPSGLGNQNFFAIDSKIRVKVTDDLKITLAGDYSKKNDGEGDQWVATSDIVEHQAYLTNILIPYVAGIYKPCAATGLYSFYKCAATNIPAGFVQSGAGKWTTASATPALATLQDYGGSAKIEANLPGVTLTSITSYREQQTVYSNDSGTDNIPWLVPIVKNKKWYFYQEVRAVSNSSGPLHFIAGATYLREHVHYNTVINYFNLSLLAGAVTDSNHDNHNWSIYGQIGYDLTDNLNLTASGRYVSLKDEAVFNSPPSAPGVPTSAIQKNSKFLPSATLSYTTGGGVIYARYAKGFKEGGINPVVSPSSFVDASGHVSPGFQFGPEEVDTFEVGARGKLFGNRVQYTTAIFYNIYKGLQATTTGDASHPGIIEAILNAGSARTYGVEGSLTWRPIDVLTVGVNAGYLNAKYKSYKQTDGTTGLNIFDLSGQQMIYAPEFQAGINVDLDQPINDKLNLVGSTLVSHISKTIQSEIPYLVVQPAYWLVNMRIGVRTADKRLGVFLFANNLFDQYYTTFGSSSGIGASQVEGDPRIIGGEVQIKF